MKRNLLTIFMLAAAMCGIDAQEEHPGGWDFNIPFLNTSPSNPSTVNTSVIASTVNTSVIEVGDDNEYRHPKYFSFNLGVGYALHTAHYKLWCTGDTPGAISDKSGSSYLDKNTMFHNFFLKAGVEF